MRPEGLRSVSVVKNPETQPCYDHGMNLNLRPTLACALTLFLALAAPLYSQDARHRDQQEMHRLHRDSSAYIAMLEDPARDEYQKPEAVLDALQLKPGEVIADIGAGSGYFAIRMTSRVGAEGRVYAVDISPDMIRHLNRRVRDLALSNLVSILADPGDPLLADGSVDRFFICDTWHHIENQPEYLARLRKMLKPDGQIIMIDFQKRELPLGPPLEMKIAREDLVAQLEANGFRLSQEFDFLPYQYFLIFQAR